MTEQGITNKVIANRNFIRLSQTSLLLKFKQYPPKEYFNMEAQEDNVENANSQAVVRYRLFLDLFMIISHTF